MSSKISYDEIIAMDEVCSFFSILGKKNAVSGISVPDVYDNHGHLKEEQD